MTDDGPRATTTKPSDLTKLTVNLVPSAVTALTDSAAQTGDTRTDTVNRALQIYAMVIEAAEAGRGGFVIDHHGELVGIKVRRVRRATTTFGLAIAVLMSLLLILMVVLAIIGAAWVVG